MKNLGPTAAPHLVLRCPRLPKQADSPPTDASGEVESLPEPLRKQVRRLA